MDPYHISFVERKKAGQNICSCIKIAESYKGSKIEEKMLRRLMVQTHSEQPYVTFMTGTYFFSNIQMSFSMKTKRSKLSSSVHCCPISTHLFTTMFYYFASIAQVPSRSSDVPASLTSTSSICTVLLLLFSLTLGSEGDSMNKLLLSGVQGGQPAHINRMVD